MASVDLGQMVIDHVESIGNVDIIWMVAHIDLGLQQFSRCPSATSTDIQKEDIAIANGWIGRMEKTYDVFAGQPQLYLPKAHPSPQPLPTPPVINIIQNPSIQHLMYQLVALRTELLHTEDAERMNSFHDRSKEAVYKPWMEKFKKFVTAMQENLNEPANTWLPDADLQEPGVNAGEPR